jgi:hypothetical protein
MSFGPADFEGFKTVLPQTFFGFIFMASLSVDETLHETAIAHDKLLDWSLIRSSAAR